MTLSCSLGSLLSIPEVISCARRLSDAGAGTLWIPETWGMENFAMLGAVSAAAPSVRIGSSIINVYSRSPAAIAMGAATIDAISGGRLILGLGASSPAIVSGLHGMPYESPLLRVKESMDVIRLALSGKKIDYHGQIFDLSGFKLLIDPVRNSIPIYIAAVNPKMVNLAWSSADGVIFYLRPIHEMRNTINQMRAEHERNIKVACQIISCVSDDAYAAMERARRTISFYVSVGAIYRKFLAEHGFAEQTVKIYKHFKKDGLGAVHRLVSDEMVGSLAIAGTPQECRMQLGRFKNAGIEHPILQFNPVGDDVAASLDVFTDAFFGGRV